MEHWKYPCGPNDIRFAQYYLLLRDNLPCNGLNGTNFPNSLAVRSEHRRDEDVTSREVSDRRSRYEGNEREYSEGGGLEELHIGLQVVGVCQEGVRDVCLFSYSDLCEGF